MDLSAWSALCTVVIAASSVQSLDLGNCRAALGMQSGEIPDSAISASSSLMEPVEHGPADARIRSETIGGAWCPLNPVSKDNVEYLQVDFGDLKVVTLIETQGRFALGQGQEFTEQYLIEYQREDNGRWFRYRSRRGHELFQGNANTYMSELREISPPIISRRIRVLPYSVHSKVVCLRVEFYGCTWSDGVVSYDMRQGDRRGNDLDFYDYTYDGSVLSSGNRLVGGLGQLTDGEEGLSNFRLDPSNIGRRGYEWVGWKSDSFMTSLTAGTVAPVDIDFRFDAVRNFSSVTLHVGNAFNREVRVFRSLTATAEVDDRHSDASTSDDGTVFNSLPVPVSVEWRRLSNPVVFEYERDDVMDIPRNVTVPLKNIVGRRIVLNMNFDARWIMISEVRFVSEYVSDELLKELLAAHRRQQKIRDPDVEATDDVVSRAAGGKHRNKTWRPNTSGAGSEDGNGNLLPPGVDTTGHDITATKPIGNSQSSDSREFGVAIVGSNDEVYVVVTSSNVTSYSDDVNRGLGDKYIALIVGALSALILGLLVVAIVVFIRHRRYTCMPINYTLPKLTSKHSSSSQSTSAPPISKSFISFSTPQATISNDNSKSTTAGACQLIGPSLGNLTSFYASLSPPTPSIVKNTDSLSAVDSPLPSTALPPANPVRRLPSPPLQASITAACVARDRALTTAMIAQTMRAASNGGQWVNRNHEEEGTQKDFNVFDTSLSHDAASTSIAAIDSELSLEKLKFLERLGDWPGGVVHLAAVSASRSQRSSTMTIGMGTLQSRRRSKSKLVVVRTLHDDTDDDARAEFLAEARTLAEIDDVTVARILAVVESPPTAVLEYGERGDLKTFLRQLAGPPSSSSTDGFSTTTAISYGRLLHMASQIASAMNHFETRGLVHGDLAARNCLVSIQCTVKVCDLGRNQPRHLSDYCTWSPYAGLPVRWMATETLVMDKYSACSDVWAFAVTLWEILTLGRHLPYTQLTDEQVVANSTRRGGSGIRPPRPSLCTPEVYDLMAECWNSDESRRPTFREIDMFLRRKNMGFRPEHDLISLPNST